MNQVDQQIEHYHNINDISLVLKFSSSYIFQLSSDFGVHVLFTCNMFIMQFYMVSVVLNLKNDQPDFSSENYVVRMF